MNTQSNAVPESRSDTQVVASTITSATRPLYWSIRRELWENRSIYIAPLAVACLSLFGFLIATIGRGLATQNLAQRQAVLEEPYNFATGLIMATAFIVGIFYSLDALHGERRDRSILFWKSLPVSDLTTVLAKASIPIVILPLLTFVIVVITQWIMLLLSTLVLLGSGLSAATLWRQVTWSQMMLLYHLLTVHVLWHAPIYAWLLLVSAWARRMVFLWAALPPLAIGVLEKMAFNTKYFAAMVGYRLSGPEAFSFSAQSHSAIHPMSHFELGKFLSAPGLWIGLVIAAIFLAGAVQLRRYREPI
jgi:ABC-2 type transport system permease protein